MAGSQDYPLRTIALNNHLHKTIPEHSTFLLFADNIFLVSSSFEVISPPLLLNVMPNVPNMHKSTM